MQVAIHQHGAWGDAHITAKISERRSEPGTYVRRGVGGDCYRRVGQPGPLGRDAAGD